MLKEGSMKPSSIINKDAFKSEEHESEAGNTKTKTHKKSIGEHSN